MGRFNSEAYEALLRNAKAETAGEDDDLSIISDSVEDFIRYVGVVCAGENELNSLRERDQAVVEAYDGKRHNAHDNAITSVKVLNRLAEHLGIEKIFSGNPDDRHQVADFCMEISGWLFQNRRKVL